jgi:hypothetical protein
MLPTNCDIARLRVDDMLREADHCRLVREARAARRVLRPEGSGVGKGGVAVLLGIACVLLASSCGQSTPSATTPSAVPSPTPTASPPPGGPLPAQLLGNWYLPGAAVTQVTAGTIPCPSNPTPTNCFFQLMLGATTWSISYVASGGIQVPSQGTVVVNNTEMDFFNSVYCGPLPTGLGRFTWSVTAGVLYFTLISDECTRAHVLTNRGWIRTLVAGQPGG